MFNVIYVIYNQHAHCMFVCIYVIYNKHTNLCLFAYLQFIRTTQVLPLFADMCFTIKIKLYVYLYMCHLQDTYKCMFNGIYVIYNKHTNCMFICMYVDIALCFNDILCQLPHAHNVANYVQRCCYGEYCKVHRSCSTFTSALEACE